MAFALALPPSFLHRKVCRMSEYPKEFEGPGGKRALAHTPAEAVTLQFGRGYKEVSKSKAKAPERSEKSAAPKEGS